MIVLDYSGELNLITWALKIGDTPGIVRKGETVEEWSEKM